MNRSEVQAALLRDMSEYIAKVNIKTLDVLLDKIMRENNILNITSEDLIYAITREITQTLEKIAHHQQLYSQFNTGLQLSLMASKEKSIGNIKMDETGLREVMQLVGVYSKKNEPFGVRQKLLKKVSDLEFSLSLYLQWLGNAIAYAMEPLNKDNKDNKYNKDEKIILWNKSGIEKTTNLLLLYQGDDRVRLSALRALNRVLQALRLDNAKDYVDESILEFVFKMAQDASNSTWIQCESLNILAKISMPHLESILNRRLQLNTEITSSKISSHLKDDFFVRRHAVNVIADYFTDQSKLLSYHEMVTKDPNPFVRQALPNFLRHLNEDNFNRILDTLLFKDVSPQVRASGYLALSEYINNEQLEPILLNNIKKALETEKDIFVLRVIMETTVALFEKVVLLSPNKMELWWSTLAPLFQWHHFEGNTLIIRRCAAAYLERLWCFYDQDAFTLRNIIMQSNISITFNTKIRLVNEIYGQYSDQLIARVLSVLSQDDFGYEIGHHLFKKRWILRGMQRGFKLWCFFYTMSHPAADKRQDHPHTVAPFFAGSIIIPSMILAETSESKVPGEPLLMPVEFGWRPYLPLVSYLLSALKIFSTITVDIYTSEGILTVTTPRTFLSRLKAMYRIMTQYDHFVKLRNWEDQIYISQAAYISELGRLGFSFQLTPLQYSAGVKTGIDPSVERFFYVQL